MKQLMLTIAILLSLGSISQPIPLKEEIFFQDHFTLIDYATYDSAQQYQLKNIDLPGRVSIEYAEHGNASGIPVIMLHGLSDSWHSYELVLDHLPNSIRAIALSLRGHGESGKPDSKYRPEDFADDVAVFMKELKIEKDCIWLLPANDDFKPIKITPDHDFQVWGIVTTVIHKLKNVRTR